MYKKIFFIFLLLMISSCSKFKKPEVEREFEHFVDLLGELGVQEVTIIKMYENNDIETDLYEAISLRLHSTRYNLENVLDVIFIYKHADFTNFDNYQKVYNYLDIRFGAISSNLKKQKIFIDHVVKTNQNAEIIDYCKYFSNYIKRIDEQINLMREKIK